MRPPGFIPILLFFSAGITSSARVHPQLAFFFRRDYFFCADESLSYFFVPQGLFRPPGFISILLFFSAGMISSAQMHLYLAFLCRRDDFFRSDVSLSCSFSLQGLLLPPGFILILLFSSAGIISSAQMHLYLALFHCRDHFFRSDASLSCSFVLQGLFRPPGFISILLFSPQGLLRPPGFISILLFCAAGITSSAQIHLYLALFHHRDYCDRPDSSLSYSFVPQG